jgi:hypothetical protein
MRRAGDDLSCPATADRLAADFFEALCVPNNGPADTGPL